MILPIRTECEIHRTPTVNYLLIGANMLVFLLSNDLFLGKSFAAIRDQYMVFHSIRPAFHQFFTYQFLHADAWHLLGNMLFLWVFGNGVNAKMGDFVYLLFYLTGGVFSAWGYAVAMSGAFQLIGASGSIAAVTAAYLVLFPRSRVTVLLWLFLFIHFIDVSALVLICLKIIVWDNIIAPRIGGAGQVAHTAHLAGYVFGFVFSVLLLLLRALPRDQFDMLALWKRWKQRREFAAAMTQPGAAERARYGTVARPVTDARAKSREDELLDTISKVRLRIGEALDRDDMDAALEEYRRLKLVAPEQCMNEQQQMGIGREFYAREQYGEAAEAFERFVACYPRSSEADNVTFLLGIIYARHLQKLDEADRILTRTFERMRDEQRRAQCLDWLRQVRASLGRPAPEV